MNTQKTRQPGSPPRPRRAAGGGRSAKAAIRREQVLAAALELFCEHGYAATSTRRIAEKAGITEGLVFHYFATKDALLLELASRQHMFAGRTLTLVRRAGEGTARELFQAVADGFAAVSPAEAAFIGFMLAEAQVNPSLRSLITSATAVVLEGLVAALASHVAAGELRADASLSAAAHGFFGGFLFFFTQHRHLGEAAWRREAAAFAHAWAEQCWRGLASLESLSNHSNQASVPRPKESPRCNPTR